MVAGRALAIGSPSKETTAAASISDACASRSASARSSWLERLVASGMVGTSLAAALGAWRPATSPSAHNSGCLNAPSVRFSTLTRGYGGVHRLDRRALAGHQPDLLRGLFDQQRQPAHDFPACPRPALGQRCGPRCIDDVEEHAGPV